MPTRRYTPHYTDQYSWPIELVGELEDRTNGLAQRVASIDRGVIGCIASRLEPIVERMVKMRDTLMESPGRSIRRMRARLKARDEGIIAQIAERLYPLYQPGRPAFDPQYGYAEETTPVSANGEPTSDTSLSLEVLPVLGRPRPGGGNGGLIGPPAGYWFRCQGNPTTCQMVADIATPIDCRNPRLPPGWVLIYCGPDIAAGVAACEAWRLECLGTTPPSPTPGPPTPEPSPGECCPLPPCCAALPVSSETATCGVPTEITQSMAPCYTCDEIETIPPLGGDVWRTYLCTPKGEMTGTASMNGCNPLPTVLVCPEADIRYTPRI